MNAGPAAMAAIKALSASTAASLRSLAELGNWADAERQAAEERMGVPAGDLAVLSDPTYDGALDVIQRALLIKELTENLLRDFTTRTTSNHQGGSAARAGSAASAPAPALPGGSQVGH